MTNLSDTNSWPIYIRDEKFLLVRIQRLNQAPTWEIYYKGERICNLPDREKAQKFAMEYLMKLRKQ